MTNATVCRLACIVSKLSSYARIYRFSSRPLGLEMGCGKPLPRRPTPPRKPVPLAARECGGCRRDRRRDRRDQGRDPVPAVTGRHRASRCRRCRPSTAHNAGAARAQNARTLEVAIAPGGTSNHVRSSRPHYPSELTLPRTPCLSMTDEPLRLAGPGVVKTVVTAAFLAAYLFQMVFVSRSITLHPSS